MNVNNSILYLLGLVSSPKGVCFPSFGRPAGGKYQINYLARERKVARSLVNDHILIPESAGGSPAWSYSRNLQILHSFVGDGILVQR